MTTPDPLRALAEAANRTAPPSMHHGFINDDYLVWEAARRAFEEAATPFAVLALLDEAEARVTALREAIGYTDEEHGLEHWHYARGGRTSPDERAGVFVDRQQVLDAIDKVLG